MIYTATAAFAIQGWMNSTTADVEDQQTSYLATS